MHDQRSSNNAYHTHSYQLRFFRLFCLESCVLQWQQDTVANRGQIIFTNFDDTSPCTTLQGKGAMALVEGDVEVVASYLATHYHWAAKALAAGSLDGCTMFAAHLILGAVEAAHAQSVAATAKAAPAALARQQAARGKGRRVAAVANAGGASSGDAGAGEAAAAAFPFAAVRKLIAAARGVDGFAGLHVEVKETLVLAEVAVRRLAPAVGEVGGEGEAE